MPSAPVAIIDTLNALLESEQNSVFRFMDEGSPYLSRATADVRRPLQEMVKTNARHVQELASLIDMLGGTPIDARRVQSEEQFLAFLSLKFLLPKLVHAKDLTIQRYENALKSLRNPPADVKAVMDAHLVEHRAQRDILEHAAANVIANSK